MGCDPYRVPECGARGRTLAVQFYDRYGNRYQAAASTPGNLNHGVEWLKIETGDIKPQTNRYTLPQISYNGAGQMTRDTYFRSAKYTYDANGRVRSWMRPDNTGLQTNTTDGVGARVMVFDGTNTRHIVSDAFGRITAEYTSGAGLESENIYRGAGSSAPLARRSTAGGQTTVKWEMTDAQGSVRLLSDATGAATDRYDYTPFGESVGAGVGTRATTPGYTGGQVRHRFAGMTSDYTMTTLEDTPWRKMDARAGRWTTPDPYLGSMSISDPQSFDRYAYVQNDPVNFVDPSGLNMAAPGSSCRAGGSSVENGIIGMDGKCYAGPGESVTVSGGSSTSPFGRVIEAGYTPISTIFTPLEPSGGGRRAPQAASLNRGEQQKYDKAQNKLLDKLLKDKTKCADFLARQGFSLDQVRDHVGRQRAFSGSGSRNITAYEAGIEPRANAL